jgi:four helix bundle protein
MRNFRELKVWEKSHQITLAVYRATAHYPKDELYGLTSQTRRASTSIPANIAEGCARATDADFARFMQNAISSASELEYHLLLSHDLGYLSPEAYAPLDEQVVEIKKMLTAFIQRLRANR